MKLKNSPATTCEPTTSGFNEPSESIIGPITKQKDAAVPLNSGITETVPKVHKGLLKCNV